MFGNGKAESQISQGKDKNCAKSCYFISVCRAATEIEQRLGILKPMWSGLTGSVTWLQQKSAWWARTLCWKVLFSYLKLGSFFKFSAFWTFHLLGSVIVDIWMQSEHIWRGNKVGAFSIILVPQPCSCDSDLFWVSPSWYMSMSSLLFSSLGGPCELRHILSPGWTSTLLCCSSYPSWQSLFSSCCPCSLPAWYLVCPCCPECFWAQ